MQLGSRQDGPRLAIFVEPGSSDRHPLQQDASPPPLEAEDLTADDSRYGRRRRGWAFTSSGRAFRQGKIFRVLQQRTRVVARLLHLDFGTAVTLGGSSSLARLKARLSSARYLLIVALARPSAWHG